MALCSESIGKMVAPCFLAVLMTKSPAITSDSLLANKILLPAPAAANVDDRPAAPTMAAITMSASGCALNSQMAC